MNGRPLSIRMQLGLHLLASIQSTDGQWVAVQIESFCNYIIHFRSIPDDGTECLIQLIRLD